MQRYTVAVSQTGVRLERFVKELFPGHSRRDVQVWIRDGKVLCNGRPGKKGTILAPGDCVEFASLLPETPGAVLQPDPEVHFEILYRDSFLIALDKPAGISTHPLRPGEMGTLANGLLAHCPEVQGIGYSDREPGLLHRLDRGTSGVVLAALKEAAFENLRLQFEQERVIKVYAAVVVGVPPARGLIDFPIGSAGRRSSRLVTEVPGKSQRRLRHIQPAQTRCRLVRSAGRYSLVRLLMTSGVRHQLRVHLAGIGHPVVGDSLYAGPVGRDSDSTGMLAGRHLLHASAIVFYHPADGRRLRILSPLPEDFRTFARTHSLL